VSESVKSRRREVLWAWLSLVTLLIAWDRAARLDEPASVPRVRLAQALDREEKALAAATARALNDRGLRTR
jgi:hypothetical protein